MKIKNEMGAIVYFAQHCEEYGYEILDIKCGFPDALVLYNGVELLVEFEYKLKSFIEHGHDPMGS